MTDSDKVSSPETDRLSYLFRKSLPQKMKLYEILNALGSTENQTCLDIGADNGMISYHLRRRGGKWHSAVTSESAMASVRAIVAKNIHVLKSPALPFKDGIFDAVVIVDFLERTESDYSFIEECHRILKPDGRLVVSVSHVKSWTMIRLLRKIMGQTHEKLGLVRPGYSESQLFSILKHGFDVHNVRSYSRFFVEFTDTVVKFLAGRITLTKEDGENKLMRLYSVAGPLYWLADQLDMLLFLTKGHSLIAVAKRRVWRPRTTPILIDGRSISEAVLSRIEN